MIQRQRVMIGQVALAAIMNGCTWFVLYWWLPRTDADVVLHYNIYFGIDLFGPWYKVWYVPLSGVAGLLINTCLAVWLQHREPILSTMLLSSTIIMQACLVVAALVLIRINS